MDKTKRVKITTAALIILLVTALLVVTFFISRRNEQHRKESCKSAIESAKVSLGDNKIQQAINTLSQNKTNCDSGISKGESISSSQQIEYNRYLAIGERKLGNLDASKKYAQKALDNFAQANELQRGEIKDRVTFKEEMFDVIYDANTRNQKYEKVQ